MDSSVDSSSTQPNESRWSFSWPRWKPTSSMDLIEAEKKILKGIHRRPLGRIMYHKSRGTSLAYLPPQFTLMVPIHLVLSLLFCRSDADSFSQLQESHSNRWTTPIALVLTPPKSLVKVGDKSYINTIKLGRGPPIVLLHGLCAGLGLWVWYEGLFKTSQPILQ
jgi:hypothetical protein